MMLQANFAPEWWADAMIMAADTTDFLPSISSSKASPNQLFKKLSPHPDFLRPFGCRA
jgi:hypothetical protein